MNKLLAQWHLQPELSEARRIREKLAVVLAQHQVPEADAFLLACAELIVNLHNYPEPKPSSVRLSFFSDEYSWWLELLDNGPSFNDFSRLINDPDPVAAAESGMGLKLLAHYFSEISYIPACYRDDACNQMLLRQPLTKELTEKPIILIVDDDPSYRALVSAYLSSEYQVIESENVRQGFDAVLRYKPELVICDIKMPESDGPVLFEQISHIPDVSDTAFIYLSGCNDPDLIAQAVSRPIDDFLEKPVTKAKLFDRVQRVLHRRQHLSKQIRRELEEKVTLGLKPSLSDPISGFKAEVRTLCPEAGGGDLLQQYPKSNSSLLLLADLMGHGLGAKGYAYALAGYLRGLCAALSLQKGDLDKLFKRLSSSFNSDTVLKETLTTIIALQIEDDGDIHILNAGQPYPIIINQQGAQQVTVNGPLLGLTLIEDTEYLPYTFRLLPGERLLIFSDGFNDAAEPIAQELLETINDSLNLPLSAAADLILQQRLRVGDMDDDLTFILLEKEK